MFFFVHEQKKHHGDKIDKRNKMTIIKKRSEFVVVSRWKEIELNLVHIIKLHYYSREWQMPI